MNVGDLKYLLSKFTDDQDVVFTGFAGHHQFVVETCEMGFNDVYEESWPRESSPGVCMICVPQELVRALQGSDEDQEDFKKFKAEQKLRARFDEESG